MTLRISKCFSFAASHTIDGLASDHKCSRLHGHSYIVRVGVTGIRDGAGMILDYGHLSWVRDLIAERLDHRHLNEVLPVNPTAENIAVWLADEMEPWIKSRPEAARITAVEVAISESRDTWAIEERQL